MCYSCGHENEFKPPMRKWSDQQEPWDLFQKSNQKQKTWKRRCGDGYVLIDLSQTCLFMARSNWDIHHLVFADLKSTKKPQSQGYIRTCLFNFSRGEKVWPVQVKQPPRNVGRLPNLAFFPKHPNIKMSCCSILEETGVLIKLGPPKLGPGKNMSKLQTCLVDAACMSACSTIIFSKQCCATPIPQNFAGEGRGVLFKLQVHQFDPWGVLGGFSSSSASCSLGSRVVLDASRCSGEMLYILWCNVYTFNRKMTSCSLAAIGLISRSTTPQVFF